MGAPDDKKRVRRRGVLGEDLIRTPDKRTGKPDPVPNRRRRKRVGKREIERVDKMNTALRMRTAGASTEQIAKELGYHDRSGASKLIKEALRSRLAESVDEMRELENHRLDSLLLAAWPDAMKGDWRKIEMVLRTIEAKRALNGLDAPTRVTVDSETRKMVLTVDATHTEVRNQLHEMLRARPAAGRPAELGPAPGELPALPDVVIEGDVGG